MVKSDDARKKDKKNLLPYFTQSGKDREKDGDQYLANLRDGSWCGFKYFHFDGTERTLTVSVRGSGMGTMKVYTDRSGTSAAAVPVRPSRDWMKRSGTIRLTEGDAPLYFVFEGSGSLDFEGFEIK